MFSFVHLPSFLSKKLILIKYTDTVPWKEITCPHSILETVMHFEQLLLTNWFTSTAAYIPFSNTHAATVVNTAKIQPVGLGWLFLYNKPFWVGQVRNFSTKKFLGSSISYTYYQWLVPNEFRFPEHSRFPLIYFRYSFQRSPKNNSLFHVLLSISCQLLYSYSTQFLPPLFGVGCFILPIIFSLYRPVF